MSRAASHRPLPKKFYRRPATQVAPDLLGRYLVHEAGGEPLVLRIVETEAYLGAADRASHAWNDRRTPRTAALYRDGGFAYVYLIYGMHHMLNVVTGTSDDGSAVLLRAGEPVRGESAMRRLRGLTARGRAGDVAGGPGKLCRALGVDGALERSRPLARPPAHPERRPGRARRRSDRPTRGHRLRRRRGLLAAAVRRSGKPPRVATAAAAGRTDSCGIIA